MSRRCLKSSEEKFAIFQRLLRHEFEATGELALAECLATLFQGKCEDGSVGGRVEELHGRGRRIRRGVDGRRAEFGVRHAAEDIADDEQVPRRNQGRWMRRPTKVSSWAACQYFKMVCFLIKVITLHQDQRWARTWQVFLLDLPLIFLSPTSWKLFT